MDPKKMEKLMKQLGMKVEQLPADEVIIKCCGYQIKITNPEVAVMKVMGRNVYQITGEEKREAIEPSEEDIRLVIEKTGKDRKTVVEKLKELNNDLARAIMELKEESKE